MPSLLHIFLSFLILGTVFYALERRFPAVAHQPLWRKGSRTDLFYWFFNPLVTRSVSRIATVFAVLGCTLLLGHELGPGMVDGFGPVAAQPRWLIVVEMVLLGDLVGYWLHRVFHGKSLWRIHVIHHSSNRPDWLSSIRVHPLNEIISHGLRVVPLALFGFPLTALVAYIPFLGLFGLLLHANVPWRFGPFRYLIASPVFHRWHHGAEGAGLNKNFAGLFPFYDLLFGTFYMPRGQQPQVFGVCEPVPDSLLGQLAWPFKRQIGD